MYPRPVYTYHPRNFVYPSLARPARVGQDIPGLQVPDEQERIQIVWPYLILASVVGGAAFAVGSGLVNRYVFGK